MFEPTTPRLLALTSAIALAGLCTPGRLHAQLDLPTDLQPGLNLATISDGTYLREVALALPAVFGQNPNLPPRPLVVALHGTGGRIEEYATGPFRGLVEQALDRDWLVALPQGLPEDPTTGLGKIRWNTSYPDPNAYSAVAPDDRGFLELLITAAIDQLPVDPDRVYVLGFSGGGTMAQLLAATRPDDVAAVAASGSSRATLSRRADPSTGAEEYVLIALPPALGPVPAMIVHGSKEEEFEDKRPYAGGFGDGANDLLATSVTPVWDQVRYWLEANRCRRQAQVEFGPSFADVTEAAGEDGLALLGAWDEDRWRIEHYARCRRGSANEVIFLTAVGLDHQWPHADNWGFDGDRILLEFFDRHRR